uniref:Uncharacterized protein n=1 Tax=Chenopodium quinoa TaxID=63459 RepID=A0A803MYN2_CHEQI
MCTIRSKVDFLEGRRFHPGLHHFMTSSLMKTSPLIWMMIRLMTENLVLKKEMRFTHQWSFFLLLNMELQVAAAARRKRRRCWRSVMVNMVYCHQLMKELRNLLRNFMHK